MAREMLKFCDTRVVLGHGLLYG